MVAQLHVCNGIHSRSRSKLCRLKGNFGEHTTGKQCNEVGCTQPSSEKQRIDAAVIASFQCLKGCHAKDGINLVTAAPEGRGQTNGFQWWERRFWLNKRENFLTVIAVKQWNSLPQDMQNSPSFKVSKQGLDGFLWTSCFRLDHPSSSRILWNYTIH